MLFVSKVVPVFVVCLLIVWYWLRIR